MIGIQVERILKAEVNINRVDFGPESLLDFVLPDPLLLLLETTYVHGHFSLILLFYFKHKTLNHLPHVAIHFFALLEILNQSQHRF